jgi:hypothetical protein
MKSRPRNCGRPGKGATEASIIKDNQMLCKFWIEYNENRYYAMKQGAYSGEVRYLSNEDSRMLDSEALKSTSEIVRYSEPIRHAYSHDSYEKALAAIVNFKRRNYCVPCDK